MSRGRRRFYTSRRIFAVRATSNGILGPDGEESLSSGRHRTRRSSPIPNIFLRVPGLRSRSRSWSRSRPESVVLTGVGVGVSKFSSTSTPARSRSRLQHFFIFSFLVKRETKMEIENYVLIADSHDGLPCTVLLSLRLRWFPGELANSTIQFGPIITSKTPCLAMNERDRKR